MKVNLYDKNGKKTTKSFELDSKVFDVEVNDVLLRQAVHVYLSNQRQANAHTKTRADVSGGGKKPWRQKGTGRARHGSTRSPIWTKGGVAFGPRNDASFKKSLSKKMIKGAIKSALSKAAKSESLFVFEDIAVDEAKKTSSLAKVLATAKIANKTLIIQAQKSDNLVLAGNNIQKVNVTVVEELNAYQILNYQSLIILKEAASKISQMWGEPQKEQAQESKAKTETKKAKTDK